MNTIDSLKKMSEELKLQYEPQDWGIINSNSDRILEFIEYFNSNLEISNFDKFSLFELIIASYNDFLVEKKKNKDIELTFKLFLENNNNYDNHFQSILDYWKGIQNDDEYPVAKLW